MTAYYNEYEPYAAEWLRNLIKKGLIADGIVDDRSIASVETSDLGDFTQCHFFAGIGVWSYALRLAGWPDDRPVWTGSCPCQPFSAAGKQKGFADERHLWPEFHRLIAERKPPIVFGEQVASKDGLGWVDAVHADLEASGYAVGVADMCAAGIGAPHIRQRLWFVGERLADADDPRLEGRRGVPERPGERAAGPGGLAGGLADADGRDPGAEGLQRGGEQRQQPEDGGAGRVAGWPTPCQQDGPKGGPGAGNGQASRHGSDCRPGPTNGHWRDADWLHCRDGKWRPVEPGTFPLAHGAAARVGRLRAYGNAIVAQAAAEVISAFMEARP